MAHHSRMDHHPRPSLPGPHLRGCQAIRLSPSLVPLNLQKADTHRVRRRPGVQLLRPQVGPYIRSGTLSPFC